MIRSKNQEQYHSSGRSNPAFPRSNNKSIITTVHLKRPVRRKSFDRRRPVRSSSPRMNRGPARSGPVRGLARSVGGSTSRFCSGPRSFRAGVSLLLCLGEKRVARKRAVEVGRARSPITLRT